MKAYDVYDSARDDNCSTNRLAVCNDWWLRKNTIHQIDGQETLW